MLWALHRRRGAGAAVGIAVPVLPWASLCVPARVFAVLVVSRLERCKPQRSRALVLTPVVLEDAFKHLSPI